MRLEIGPRDVEKGEVTAVMRLQLRPDAPRKESIPESGLAAQVQTRLDAFQTALLEAALIRRDTNSHRGITEYAELREIIESQGGFVYGGWCGGATCDERVKADTKATIRVIPGEEFRSAQAPQKCVVCGTSASEEVVWARAY